MMQIRTWSRIFGALVAVLLLACHFCSSATAQDVLRGVALVIGESDYSHLPALANPQHDARAVGEMLSRLGFEVTTATNTDRSGLAMALERFEVAAEAADVALVYYSGHGVEIGGENYLIPIDADVSSPKAAGESLFSVNELLGQLKHGPSIAILLLDACRTSPFARNQLIELPGQPQSQTASSGGLAAVRGPQPVAGIASPNDSLGVVIGFAAEPGRSALDGPAGSNSPYASALLKHISAGNYSFSDIMTLVTEEVYLGTDGRQLPWTNSALRRVLSFGRPAPETGDSDDAMILRGRRELLLTVSATPADVRAEVASIAEQEKVPLAPMFGLLKAVGVDTDDPADLAARLQAGAEEIKARLTALSVITTPDPQTRRLLELSRRAQAEGAVEEALAFSLRASERAAELSRTLDQFSSDMKQRRVENAATFAEAADAAMLAWEFRTAAVQYDLAADELSREATDLGAAYRYRSRQANALVALGNYKGDNTALAEAINVYRKILAQLSRETLPLDWAQTQSNLGIALRMLGEREAGTALLKAAVAAHRAALEVRTRDRDQVKWAMSQNNLGLALRSLSNRTGKITELEEAAAAFERALEVQTRDSSAAEWASTQNNIGSALMSLGERNSDAEMLRNAIAAYRRALEVRTRERDPLQWAETQHNVGIALKVLSSIEGDRGQLEAAIAAYRLALEERTRAKVPLKWASTQYLLANALRTLGETANDRASLVEAIATYRLALGERTRERVPVNWATTQNDLGIALHDLGEVDVDTARLEEAIAAFQLALEVRTRNRVPLDWATTQSNLGSAIEALGEREGNAGRLEEALSIYRLVLEVRTRDRDPQKWATALYALANVTRTLGELHGDPARLDEAVLSYRQLLAVWTREDDPQHWAQLQKDLERTIGRIGELTNGKLARRGMLMAAPPCTATESEPRCPLNPFDGS